MAPGLENVSLACPTGAEPSLRTAMSWSVRALISSAGLTLKAHETLPHKGMRPQKLDLADPANAE